MTSYRLAPMSGAIRFLTVALFAIPLLFLLAPLTSNSPTGLAGVGVGVLALFAAIWIFWRPTRFDVTTEGLRIVFPGRSRMVPLSDVRGCRLMSSDSFKREFGWAMRVGAGGLWGGFGWLWTSKRGLVDFYISRTDDFLLVERRASRPLLVTPENPQSMVQTLAALVSG